ncbi:hypothetical protein EV196_11138 [Mariniflexile fucanivorans]|uniref:Lipocalin-like protein n=1 Tax=Mariniflexile fucanivorans TaxID=264023 RepID=A0A4R1RBK5_9FLAO|nr:hypothetical protein [Mariniflexile fucanivorans]TCL62842.1 hypothetical protein EV196_11138 [Mariniflexile fucanivorans]
MKKYKLLITALILILSFTSCSKDDTENGQSKKDIIESKSWVITSKTVEPSILFGAIEISDITILDSDEVKNYSFKFNPDGSLLQYDFEGNLIFETTWAFNSDETEITFEEPIMYTYPVVGEMGISTLLIETISSSKIVGTIPAFYQGVDYLVTITFM